MTSSIRRSLSTVLRGEQYWKPSDTFAVKLLKPWMNVWEPSIFEQLLEKTVIPTLTKYLFQMEINPANQDIMPVRWVLNWIDVISDDRLVQIFNEAMFFNKWFEILYQWLTNTYIPQEVATWYTSWKSEFQRLADSPVIKQHLQYALRMMQSAQEGKSGVIPPPRIIPKKAPKKSSNPVQAPVRKRELSFKELVEKTAIDENLLFMPAAKSYNGKAIYKFGLSLIYLDKLVVFRNVGGGSWSPVSLEDLIKLESGRKK
eukprot:TRINITY_DN4112_c0_g1_i1.p1 TRINITY_DN4112_c0_g1~~TRINITY_DN4112_c0_g1_i1.p1  ORF type:complete len:271 (+),score=52.87 TRINITY_DN4112_c0_g1_i1:40-813(+)